MPYGSPGPRRLVRQRRPISSGINQVGDDHFLGADGILTINAFSLLTADEELRIAA
jgi:hypothetical protein